MNMSLILTGIEYNHYKRKEANMKTTMTRKEAMNQRIKEHGENLNAIFNTGIEPIALCKKLFRLENKAHNAITCLCNTNTLNLLELNKFTGYDVKQATEEEIDAFFDKIKASLFKILGPKASLIHINFDPRGYALKIHSNLVKDTNIHKDFGGYGIIAPDFNN